MDPTDAKGHIICINNGVPVGKPVYTCRHGFTNTFYLSDLEFPWPGSFPFVICVPPPTLEIIIVLRYQL